jgi:hypothetical protein
LFGLRGRFAPAPLQKLVAAPAAPTISLVVINLKKKMSKTK